MIFLNVNQILSLPCLSLSIALGKKSKPLPKSLHDLVLCASPTSPHMAPLISHPLQPPSPLYVPWSLRVFVSESEFTFCSFCLKCFPPGFFHQWSFNFHVSSDVVPSLCSQSLPGPFWNRSLLRFILIPTAICNFLAHLLIFLLSFL